MDKIEIEDALMRLSMKGLVISRQAKTFTGKEEYYELPKEIADKVGVTKRTGLFRQQAGFRTDATAKGHQGSPWQGKGVD